MFIEYATIEYMDVAANNDKVMYVSTLQVLYRPASI